jgi:hypothetical protein
MLNELDKVRITRAAEQGAAVALRAHTHVADVRVGRRMVKWRGGVLRRVAGEPEELTVLAEAGAPLRYYGRITAMSETIPVVCLMSGKWPYQVKEVRNSSWASASDAALAREGTPGVYGVVPRSITGESDVLWRAKAWVPSES